MAKRPFLKAQQPQEPATPSRGQAFRRLLGYITAYKLQVSLSILFILLGTLALLVPGFLVGQAIKGRCENWFSTRLLMHMAHAAKTVFITKQKENVWLFRHESPFCIA